MNREHKSFLGLIIVFALLIGYGLFAGALKTHGQWLWIPLMLVLAGNIAAVIKFPKYRLWLGKNVKYGFEAVADNFTNTGRKKSERKAVPPAIQKKVLTRASEACQFPDCQEKHRENLHIHHIDWKAKNSRDENNLIAVCPNHHNRIHRDRKTYTDSKVRSWARRRPAASTRTTSRRR